MKIIRVDNFDRGSLPEVLIAENVKPYYAKYIIEFLNNKFSGDHSPEYFELEEDDYVLKERG